MNNKLEKIKQGYETAFINSNISSNLAYRPEFISNNHNEGRKVLSSIENELLNCDSFSISVAFITMSGITPLLLTLKELENKGVKGRILTTNYLNFTEPKALEKLNGLSNIEIKMYETSKGDGFHTKGYVFKEEEIYRIIVGSSNMTMNALTTNREWNSKIVSTEQGEYAKHIVKEFEELWISDCAKTVDEIIEIYKQTYELEKVKRDIIKKQKEIATEENIVDIEKYKLKPNSMQVAFVEQLKELINNGEDRGLLISATGTGKTYASAFAMRELGFKKVLFLVHRNQIAKQALKSFRKVLGGRYSMGMVSGTLGRFEYDKDYIFATVQTLSKDNVLEKFPEDYFDAIIYDEAHHVAAGSYQKVMVYFTPSFTLGMTATPDKRDDNIEGKNIYEIFNYNIAYEIRLQQAMEEDLLCPFHYFGITDLEVIGDEKREEGLRNFRYLVSEARVQNIIKQADFYGYSGDRVKGLMFCNRVDDAKELSFELNQKGLRTKVLSGADSEQAREEAIERLVCDDLEIVSECERLDYILSVDIFSEGVDVPEINQVIMLRPTESPIVFIQQLGSGLRKNDAKEYVVVLDFIGNYNKNFLIPVALSGDRSYNSDVIRKYIISGNNIIPGSSTIHFDEISKQQIFNSIDNIKSSTYKSLIKEGYINLKNRLGRIPMLFDFYENNEIDPIVIIREFKTYFSFVENMEKSENLYNLTEQEKRTLEYLYKTILSGVRPAELEILRLLSLKDRVTYSEVVENCKALYNYEITYPKIKVAYNVLKGEFVINKTELGRFNSIDILELDEKAQLNRVLSYEKRLKNNDFYALLQDIIRVGLARYKDKYKRKKSDENPFVLYEKYSRRDVSFLMDAGKDLSSTMYGMSKLGEDVFIFVTYHKEENRDEEKQYVEGKPDYADEFIDNVIFSWDSQMDKKLDGAYMDKVLNTARKHLFVQKSDAENNFFYMGEFDVVDAYQDQKKNNKGVFKPICKLKFKMHREVREDILQYLQSKTAEK